MMEPTQVLRDEHRVIETVVNCLERMADGCVLHGRLNSEAAQMALDFFRNFADRCHHAKEEDELFPLMEAKGFSRDNGPTGVMLAEHDKGREHIRAMAETVEAAANGKGSAVARFVEQARCYCRLLREHIYKEDHCLFPMAEEVLNSDERRSLASAFEAVEHGEIPAGTHQRYLKIADELARRYNVDRPDTVPLSEHGYSPRVSAVDA